MLVVVTTFYYYDVTFHLFIFIVVESYDIR